MPEITWLAKLVNIYDFLRFFFRFFVPMINEFRSRDGVVVRLESLGLWEEIVSPSAPLGSPLVG